MKIADRLIDVFHPPYVIAELSANHRGDIKLAEDTIIAAADCGASAVKIQCYEADEMAFNGDLLVEDGPWAGQRLYDLYKEAETPYKMVKEIFKFARKNRITLFASIFSPKGADLVAELGAPAIKIASFELTDTPLIEYAASKALPMIISTGMGTGPEIIAAIHAYNKGSVGGIGRNLALLHCISSYPASPGDVNLPMLGTISELVGGRHVVGFSDHTMGVGTAVAAVAFGASIIEKHFILDRSLGGPDASFSMEPADFSRFSVAIREAWQAIQPRKGSLPRPAMASYRRSLQAVCPIRAGEAISQANCRILRGGCGVAPSFYPLALEGFARQDIPQGAPILSEMVSSLHQSQACNPGQPLSDKEF